MNELLLANLEELKGNTLIYYFENETIFTNGEIEDFNYSIEDDCLRLHREIEPEITRLCFINSLIREVTEINDYSFNVGFKDGSSLYFEFV